MSLRPDENGFAGRRLETAGLEQEFPKLGIMDQWGFYTTAQGVLRRNPNRFIDVAGFAKQNIIQCHSFFLLFPSTLVGRKD